MVLLFATSKKYDKVLFTPHNWVSSLNNCHLHEISLFFVLPTYVEIILMRWLHDPLVTKLCQNPWNELYMRKCPRKICKSSCSVFTNKDVRNHPLIFGVQQFWHLSNIWKTNLPNLIPISCAFNFISTERPVIIYGRGWHQREIIFVEKIFLTQLNFVSKIFLPMQLKPIIFLYPTNCTFFIQLVYWKMVRGFDSVEVASSERRWKTKRHKAV